MKALSPEQLAQIVNLYRNGRKTPCIASLLYVSKHTIYSYLKKGEQVEDIVWTTDRDESDLTAEERMYLDFYLEANKAKADFQCECLDKIIDSKSWRAAIWILERSDSETWVKPTVVKVQQAPASDTPSKIDLIIASMKNNHKEKHAVH